MLALEKRLENNSRNVSPDSSLRRFSVVALGLLLLFFTSLAYSIYLTQVAPTLAYFSTGTRVWQFACGGLLLFVPTTFSRQIPEHLQKILCILIAWLGFAAIMYGALAFSSDTEFPGYLALIPTLGSASIIWSGYQRQYWSLARISELQAIRFIGDVSYSAYLWHWPLIIAFPYVFERSYTVIEGAWIALFTLLLAWLTKIAVEDPVRKRTIFAKNTGKIYTFAALSMLCFTLVTVPGYLTLHKHSQAGTQIDSFETVEQIQDLLAQTLTLNIWPEADQPAGQQAQVPEWIVDNCIDVSEPEDVLRCVYGNRSSAQTLLVIGDSWATHLLPAIRQAFGKNWRIHVVTLSQCPLADVNVHKWGSTKNFDTCTQHRERTFEYIRRTQPALIIASDSPISTYDRLMPKLPREQALQELMRGTELVYARLYATGIQTLVLESPPRSNCMPETSMVPRLCSTNENTRLERELSIMRLKAAEKSRIKMLDTALWLCSSELVCPSQIGNYLVKADGGHFAGSFSRKLGKVLRAWISQNSTVDIN